MYWDLDLIENKHTDQQGRKVRQSMTLKLRGRGASVASDPYGVWGACPLQLFTGGRMPPRAPPPVCATADQPLVQMVSHHNCIMYRML